MALTHTFLSKIKSLLPVTRTFNTGNRPIQVFCDNEQDYVVKSNQGKTPAFRMIKEYLGSHFAQLWGLETPAPGVVEVQKEHLKEPRFSGNASYYDGPCFGSVFSPMADDWDKLVQYWGAYDISKVANRADLLKIVLFDFWLANEDRFHENHNLLILNKNGAYTAQVIDHESIFNALDSNNNVIYFDSELMLPEMHLLQSRSFLRVIGNPKNLKAQLDSLGEKFNTFTDLCKQKTPEIIAEMPKAWEADQKILERYINEVVTDNIWLEKVYEYFRREVKKAIY